MITITNPAELEWFTTPLPSASVVHRDCRIIIWNNVLDEYIETAVLQTHPTYPEYWIDEKKKVWAPSQFKISSLRWTWFKKFR